MASGILRRTAVRDGARTTSGLQTPRRPLGLHPPFPMSTPRVTIYDTTLRDGTQGTGISFSVLDKIRVAERLDEFGVHYIEGGWPGANPRDETFFAQAAQRTWKHAQINAFG